MKRRMKKRGLRKRRSRRRKIWGIWSKRQMIC
jgi:hypothetical protein